MVCRMREASMCICAVDDGVAGADDDDDVTDDDGDEADMFFTAGF